MKARSLKLDQWLSLAEVECALPAMRQANAARVARGDAQSSVTGPGFLPNYRKAKGSRARMKTMQARPGESWAKRRDDFVRRHMAQARKNGERLFDRGIPSKRMLGLIAWAYVPPEWDDAYALWAEAGWPTKAQKRRNGAFSPPSRRLDRPQYDVGYGPWHPDVNLVPMAVIDRLGSERKSNLDAPVDFDLNEYPEGTWFKDRWNSLYGHHLWELVWVDTNDVSPTELVEGRISAHRAQYIEPYTEWIAQGHQPPPVRLIETEDGALRLTDGHRRYVVSRSLGAPLLALVSYAVPTGSMDTNGRPIKDGLTLEIARQDADLIGRMDPAMGRKIRAWEKQNKPELVARRKALEKGKTRSNGAPPPSAWDAPDREASTVQSIIFDRTVWTARGAKRWLREHDYKAPNVDRQPNVYRFRQHAPFLFHKDSFRTIPFGAGTGIQATVAIPK